MYTDSTMFAVYRASLAIIGIELLLRDGEQSTSVRVQVRV
jgi:hypothetical protein